MAHRSSSRPSQGSDATEALSPGDLLDILDQGAKGVLGEGAALGAYVIDRVLGEGGGGIVYAAHHADSGAPVAIKVLRPEMVAFPTMIKRFVREAEAVHKIDHPNIVKIFEFGETEERTPYYVMELLDGLDLRKVMKAHGRFTPREAQAIFEPVCQAVQAAHEAGFIHRDIKANNVAMVEREGCERVVKLLDFGIAKILHGEPGGQGLTEPGATLGSPHSMAPEQIRGERVDQRVDIYALGVLLFQMLTAQYPFYAPDPRETALMHLQSPPPRPSSFAPVSPALEAVVLRCLEKNRDKRFSSVSELLAAFKAAVSDSPGMDGPDASSAIGVYFQLSTAGDEDDMDDDMIEDISNVLDTVESNLIKVGYQLPLRTSSALLGVRVIENDDNRIHDRAAAEALLAEIRKELEARQGRHPRVIVSASLTIGEALCRESPEGKEVIGGPLLEVDTWTSPGRRAAG